MNNIWYQHDIWVKIAKNMTPKNKILEYLVGWFRLLEIPNSYSKTKKPRFPWGKIFSLQTFIFWIFMVYAVLCCHVNDK